jgi:hypothetical protein
MMKPTTLHGYITPWSKIAQALLTAACGIILLLLLPLPPLPQGLPKGRLLAYYPANRTTHVISHEFYYSNGVALSADGTYAAVCETDRLRVLK